MPPQGYYDHRSCLTIFWRMMESSMVLVATGLLTGLITLAVNLIISYFSPMGLMIAGALRQHAVIAGVVSRMSALLPQPEFRASLVDASPGVCGVMRWC